VLRRGAKNEAAAAGGGRSLAMSLLANGGRTRCCERMARVVRVALG